LGAVWSLLREIRGHQLTKVDPKHLKIRSSEEVIVDFLQSAVLQPRLNLLKWSQVTKQTQNMRVGYPFQHFASLITGVEGVRTGARGDDLADNSEVKSCSRADQVDKCKECKSNVSRHETHCMSCGSQNIKRNNDSKWLFAVKTPEELELLTRTIDRVLLTIVDYKNFDDGDYDTVNVASYEIWPKETRHLNFRQIMENYYNNIYSVHREKNPKKGNIAPKNFWPYSYQFHLCNPIRTFQATIYEYNTNPTVQIDHWVKPDEDRANYISDPMPAQLLNSEELIIAGKSAADTLNESERMVLPLRDDRTATANEIYRRF